MITVDLHYRLDSTGPVEALLRSKDELKSLGFDVVEKIETNPTPEPKKLLALQQFYATPEALSGPSPIVLLERADASICWCRREAQHPNVKRVVKIGVLRPASLNNHCWGRYHSALLDKDSVKPCRVLLSEKHLSKIVPGASYGSYNLMKRWVENEVNIFGPRPHVIHFAGTTHYGDRKEITKHRVGALRAIKRIKGKHVTVDGRHIPRDEYDAKMLASKIVLSPWGFGESAYRDYEAMYAGAVLIKPDSSFVKTWPNVFVNGVTYIPCAPDWLDLADKVDYVLDSWKELEGMRVSNRDLLLKHWPARTIAKHYASIFKAAIDGE